MTRCALALLELSVSELGYAIPQDVHDLCRALEAAWDRIAELERDQGIAVVVSSRVKIEEEPDTRF